MAPKSLRLAYWISFTIAAASLVVIAVIDQHLRTRISPFGIVSFELCAYNSTCQAIVDTWDGKAKLQAAMDLGFDYLFMLAYPAVICFGLLFYAHRMPDSLQRPALLLASVVWVAGFSDAVENYHLFQMLVGNPVVVHQWPAAIAASIKFAALTPPLLAWIAATIWYAASFRATRAAEP